MPAGLPPFCFHNSLFHFLYVNKAEITGDNFFMLEVRAVPLTDDKNSESIVPILGLKSCYAIDYHYGTGDIYIADDGKNIIYKVKTDGSSLQPIISTGLEKPQGIAVDWVAGNIYWTDAGTDLIEVGWLFWLILVFIFFLLISLKKSRLTFLIVYL